MVTIAPKEKGWSDVGEAFGTGFVSGHQNRHDEMALQNAISGLGDNASMKDVLKAITGTRTYSPEAKQNLLKNYLGTEEFEETRRHHKATEETNKLNKEIKETEKLKAQTDKEGEFQRKRRETGALYKELNPNANEEEIEKAKDTYSVETLRRKLEKEDTTEYKTAENFSKRFEPEIKTISENSEKARKSIPGTEAAILTNEKYTSGEKVLDNVINAIDSPFLKPLMSSSGQQLQAYSPLAIAAFSDKMSGVMSVRKIALIEKKAAAIDKSKESNRLFMYMDLYDKKLDQLRKDFSDEIIEKSKFGLAPKNFDQQLKEKMKPYQKMIDQDISLLLDGKMPNSAMSQTNLQKYKDQTPEGRTLMLTPDGKRKAYVKSELVNTPQYKDWTAL